MPRQRLDNIKIVSKKTSKTDKNNQFEAKQNLNKKTEKVEKTEKIEKTEKDMFYNDFDLEGGEFSDDIIEQADFTSAEEKKDGDVKDPEKELNEDIDDDAIEEDGETEEEEEEVEEQVEDDEEDKLEGNEGYGDEEEKVEEQEKDESCLYNFTKKIMMKKMKMKMMNYILKMMM